MSFIEIVFGVIVFVLVVSFPVYFIYKSGEQKGRLKEMRRQLEEKNRSRTD